MLSNINISSISRNKYVDICTFLEPVEAFYTNLESFCVCVYFHPTSQSKHHLARVFAAPGAIFIFDRGHVATW